MSENSSGTESEQSETPASPSKGRILVAEDSAPNRRILVHLLTKLGFEVLACENGKKAFDALSDNPDFQAVFSDIMMPEMDGLELLKAIRADEKLKSIPVVLLTAMPDKEYIMEAKKEGVNGYVLKPVTFERVTKKVKDIFPGVELPTLAA